MSEKNAGRANHKRLYKLQVQEERLRFEETSMRSLLTTEDNLQIRGQETCIHWAE
jgi:hypothetical protein